MNLLKLAVAASLIGTSAVADIYECERTYLNQNGFETRSGAESWHPKELVVEIKGDAALSDYFGEGTVEDRGARLFISFPAVIPGVVTGVTMTIIKKNNRYSQRIETGGAYVQVGGAGGKCKKVG